MKAVVEDVKPLLEKPSNTSDNDYHRPSKDAMETITILENLSRVTSSGIESLFREALPLMTSVGYESNLTSSCLASFLKLLSGIRRQETWAFRLIDSFGRIPAGTFDGTVR
jgi:hypothetical protein